VELGERNSVLDAILKIRDEVDGSVGIRCSCQQAICGSCGVRMNGKPGLACNTHLEVAAARRHGTGWNPEEDGDGDGNGAGAGIIEVEPMGNMPVIRDLIVDMDAVHWKKIERVTPYLINKEPVPDREYIVPHDNMVDVTQTMACIQCGACVSDCLSMEIDPLFIGPAALAKAYRFVGDPRDAEHFERLKDLSEDPHGIYDCTHCFNCIDACPKDVAPMSQIMRLRRKAGTDHEIVDANNGHRHEEAFITLVRDYGLLNEAELLPRSYGGDSWFAKFHPAAGKELLSSISTVITGVVRGKISPKIALMGHKLGKSDLASLKRIYGEVEGREQRDELNLYVTGYEDDPAVETASSPSESENS
jgi:succinate dehydrogenase / fumarate reductase iron-sulfur subunit